MYLFVHTHSLFHLMSVSPARLYDIDLVSAHRLPPPFLLSRSSTSLLRTMATTPAKRSSSSKIQDKVEKLFGISRSALSRDTTRHLPARALESAPNPTPPAVRVSTQYSTQYMPIKCHRIDRESPNSTNIAHALNGYPSLSCT